MKQYPGKLAKELGGLFFSPSGFLYILIQALIQVCFIRP